MNRFSSIGARPPTPPLETLAPSENGPRESKEPKGTTSDQRTTPRPPSAGRASVAGRSSYYYWQTLRPIVCLAFVIPWLLFYETAVLMTDSPSVRGGVDAWLQWAFDRLGLGPLVILPLVTIVALLVRHHWMHDDWRFDPRVLLGMLVESAGLGLILYWAAAACHLVLAPQVMTTEMSEPISSVLLGPAHASWVRTVAYVGSGIYEELVFRLLLFSGLVIWSRRWFSHPHPAWWLAMVVSSSLFAILHFDLINPAGAPFDWGGFWFRFCASSIFCAIYLFRGFGIAVGAHVAYDILTQW